MGVHKQAGFTIIETVLFLAITGLLILMMVVGTGASLSIQRYRDSVESFKSLVQEQYTGLASVQNERSDQWQCATNNSQITSTTTSGGQIRGQSACFLVGKYMTVVDGSVKIYDVVASQVGSPGTNDITTLRQAYAFSTTSQPQTHQLEWATKIAWAESGVDTQPAGSTAARSLGVLFIRSPESGKVYTFTSNSALDNTPPTQATFTNILNANNDVPGRGQRLVCIEPGGMFVPADRGLYIGSYAAGPSAVETLTNGGDAMTGLGSRC